MLNVASTGVNASASPMRAAVRVPRMRLDYTPYMPICRRFAKAGDGTRTRDPLFTRQALYQLSYSGNVLR